MYHKLATAYRDYTKFNLKVCKPDAVLISGKRFSRSYIQEFYANVVARYDGCIEDLRKYFTKVWSVEAIADSVLNSGPNSDFAESRIAPKGSLFYLFSNSKLRSQIPETVPGTDLDVEAIAKTAADMGVCVMWMVYFSATGPYRFPDMLILKYAGNNRNLFIDPNSRCFDVITSYSKTRRANLMCKSLDKKTSDYLFHYIFVVRAILKHALSHDYDGMKRDLFNETEGEPANYLLNNFLARSVGGGDSEDDFDPVKHSNNVLNSFVFVDAMSHSLMNYHKFQSLLKVYPTSIDRSSRLSFRELRHGMIKLVREYVKVEGEDMDVMNVKEKLAGHSATTGQSIYGNDVESGVGADASLDEKYATLINSAWQYWLGLGYGIEREEGESAVAKNTCVKKYFSPNGSIKDLFVAGKKLYGKEFQFREGQFDVAVEIYLSGTQIIPIQALPGFGETALFQIPLVALSYGDKKTVSFVFVPYVCLLSNMKLRLSSCGINCGILKDLFVNGPAVEEKDLFCDVYVGTFNDLGSENFVRLVNNWYNIYQDCILGMIVIDEFHNLETEQSYRGQSFRLIPEINFNLAWKVVVMTGTAGEKGMVKPMKFIGYDKEMSTSMVSNKNRILYFDLVNQIPLKNIVKKFQVFERSTVAETEVEKLVDRFMEYDTKSKVIIVCKEKVTVEKLYFRQDSEWVHGDLPSEEKIKKSRRFIEDDKCRIMIGTKLVSEGIDIKAVKLVIMLDYLPSIGEYIQTAGRLREGGVCLSYWTKRSVQTCSVKPDVCIIKQVSKFYDLNYDGHDLCCGHHHNIPEDVANLYHYLNGDGRPRVVEVDASIGDSEHVGNVPSFSSANESSVFEDLGPDMDQSENFIASNDSSFPGWSNEVDMPDNLENSSRGLVNEDSTNDNNNNSDEILPTPRIVLLPFDHGPNKRRRIISMKDEINGLFGSAKNVFEFIGIPSKLCSQLFFYGLNESCLDFPLSVVDNPCPDCLGAKDGGCVCWEFGPAKVKKYLGLSFILLLKMIMSEKEFDGVRKHCLDRGLHAVMLRYGRSKSVLFDKFKTSALAKFCEIIVRKPKLPVPGELFSNDMVMARCYNMMWENIQGRKLDILMFFSVKDCTDQLKGLWEAGNGDDLAFKDIEADVKRASTTRYQSLPFIINFGGRPNYLVSTCGYVFEEYMILYSIDKDFKSRSLYDSRERSRKPPKVKVPAYQYIMMMFAVFHNRDFLDYFYKKFPSLPRVKCFSHWLKLMTLSVQFPNDQGRRLYLVVGAMYYLYLKGC
ncbi:DEAD/DEAH box helicase NDAI_0I00100 [Naumovozyma dairenensis CBS 421]|uniref:RNA helicase n=1 Tax=Naumovozyma dairenensis (strain ATCC 10597 / BCRC 20456 / CBS 421 / NBRC 0211 / NRRL Y-12639) TaxID=1071378 RepID=G0WFL8_NAUDC|nr:hypothetical protein NDAI_0I00100 [Naumovozyma dairenensis CBS 421]CCD26579.1 hypothetical protein NDAI_0I00100 [Naumovozyma dairenensis CBS 421]